MAKQKNPKTPAVHAMEMAGVAYELMPYRYQDKGGTAVASKELGVDHHQVVKTLVMADQDKNPLIVLMHGDCEVSTKNLARELSLKSVEPVDPATANRHTGYQVGGISPFGTRKALPVYVEKTILDLPVIYINAGKRGLLVKITPADLMKALSPTPVNAAVN